MPSVTNSWNEWLTRCTIKYRAVLSTVQKKIENVRNYGHHYTVTGRKQSFLMTFHRNPDPPVTRKNGRLRALLICNHRLRGPRQSNVDGRRDFSLLKSVFPFPSQWVVCVEWAISSNIKKGFLFEGCLLRQFTWNSSLLKGRASKRRWQNALHKPSSTKCIQQKCIPNILP